uniref:Pectin acetylesterase n=1 Tax=Leersia perrieri TaxID=77586 RepID=A0A0D9V098_9ORYZ
MMTMERSGITTRPWSWRTPLLLLLLLVFLFVAGCCVRAAEDEQMRGGGRRRSRRRRAADVMVPITILNSAVEKGAVCMDGTPPAYHLDPGSGGGNRSWIVNLEGGGWCNNARTCRFRAGSRHGSSDHMERSIPFTGIMSSSPSDNPDFHSWNRVKIRYCDSGSFAGDAFDEQLKLQFRGQRIWGAVIQHLLDDAGMASAEQVLLTGCSAGGLAAILHCDQLRALLPHAATVKCLSDGGLFLDAVDVAGGRSLRSYYGDVVAMQAVAPNLPNTCTDHLDATSCFFPQNIIDGIKTPIFLLNAAYDVWQIEQSLAPNAADANGAWKACKFNRLACNASQLQFLQGFRDQMVAAVRVFSDSRSNGLFINSCFAHCQSELTVTWNGGSPALQNKRRFARILTSP